MKNKNRAIIIICGPTAIGKTDISVKLAKNRGEIISADSMQVYRFMDIGTAKPDNSLLKQVKHHLIDVIDPDEEFSAYRFKSEAEKIIDNLYSEKKMPFIVGGTGLYIRALVYGMSEAPGKNKRIRDRLMGLLENKGVNYLYQRLYKIDPVYADKISSSDRVRILRALEVYEISGVPFSRYNQLHKKEPRYNLLWIGLNMDREKLYMNINRRTEKMFENGFVDETKKLLKMGFSKEIISRRGIGYIDVIKYLDKEITLEEAIANVQKKTRNYAKRQMTWFRKEKLVKWMSAENFEEIKSEVEYWIKNINFN